jgi:hypothetical protein
MEEYATPADFKVESQKTGSKHSFERFLNSPYFTVCIILFVAISAFCMGKFWAFQSNREPVKILNSSSSQASMTQESTISNDGGSENKSKVSINGQSATVVNSVVSPDTEVVASKNGTKYHLPTCPGAKQISDKNKITFHSITEARSAGYSPALNCKGLK